MKRIIVFGLCFMICISPSVFAQRGFKPAEVASAGDAYASYQVVFDGLFVLNVFLNEDGDVLRVDALRDPGSMLGAAKNSLHTWKFHAASWEGKPESSRITVSFVYRPPNFGHAAAVPPKDFSSVIPSGTPGPGEHVSYVPVGILSFAYPDYPINSVAMGSVVAQLTVDKSGTVTHVVFLHGMPGFNKFVSDVLNKWRFQAATLNGKPITSKTVVAFIFQPPSSN